MDVNGLYNIYIYIYVCVCLLDMYGYVGLIWINWDELMGSVGV